MFHTGAHFYPQLARLVAQIASRKLILDLGSYDFFRKELSRFKHLFADSHYLVMGYRTATSGARTDLDGDICALPLRSDSVDAIICKDVLEHVKAPATAVGEMYRTLKTGGLLYCSVPFLHPYHGGPNNPDYWRFTHEGLELLFSRFRQTQIFRSGGAVFVFRAFAPAFINRILFSRPLMPLANALDRLSLRRFATSGFMVLAEK